MACRRYPPLGWVHILLEMGRTAHTFRLSSRRPDTRSYPSTRCHRHMVRRSTHHRRTKGGREVTTRVAHSLHGLRYQGRRPRAFRTRTDSCRRTWIPTTQEANTRFRGASTDMRSTEGRTNRHGRWTGKLGYHQEGEACYRWGPSIDSYEDVIPLKLACICT